MAYEPRAEGTLLGNDGRGGCGRVDDVRLSLCAEWPPLAYTVRVLLPVI